MSRRLITEDDLDEIEERGLMQGPKIQSGIAATIEAWATRPDRYELDAELAPGDLLVQAAEHAGLAGDDGEVRRLLRLAKEVSGDGYPQGWIGAAVRLGKRHGELAEVLDIVAEWKAGVEQDAEAAFDLAEAFEVSDEFALAERWFNIALRWAEQGGEDWLYGDALVARLRVRAEQGKPEDVMDAEAAEIIAVRRSERGD